MAPRFQLVPAAYVYLLTRGDGDGAPSRSAGDAGSARASHLAPADPADGAPAQPLDGATRVLLQLRQNTGFMDGHWAAAAAGHVEQGESLFDAAVRESAEELGIAVDQADLIPATSMHRTDGSDQPIEQRVDWMFTCWRWEGTPAVVETRKVAGLEWFRLDALPLMPPHERYALESLAAGTLAPFSTFGFRPGEVIPGGYSRDPHVWPHGG